MKRALVLAGGGIKVGYQAGCLQVLLSEANFHFDIVDAASGGCFNAAMLCNGMTGLEIADAWRQVNPMDFVSLDLGQIARGPYARSINSSRGLRERVFPGWGLNFETIRAYANANVRFNVFDFTAKRLIALEHTKLTEDYLCASVALPMWFPPVVVGTQTLADAVFISDANLDEVLAQKPNEIWAIWTVSRLPAYRAGFLAQYFHIIEIAGNGNFFRSWDAIPKRVETHLIQQEVPIHYLLNLSRDRMAAAVELGVRDTRAYCRQMLPKPYSANFSPPSPPAAPLASVRFTETMTGRLLMREGRARDRALSLTVTIDIDDVASFVREPDHAARATGEIRIGGERFACSGTLRLLIDRRIGTTIEPGHKRFEYDLAFRDASGAIRTFFCVKYCDAGSPQGIWHDTTTAYVRIGPAHSGPDARAEPAILRIDALRFARELASMRGRGPGLFGGIFAVLRFVRFFLASLADTYLRRIIDYGPW